MNAQFQRQKLLLRNTLRGHSLVQILIYANLILFTLTVLHGTIIGLGMSAIFSPPTQLLVHWGAQYWPLVLNHGEWWRCLTYAYMHGGIMHLGFNMLVLYQIGPLLESELGWKRFMTVYSFAAIIATVAGLFWHPNSPVVGASGSIFGMIGFSISYYHRVGGAIGIQRRNFMFQWAVMAFIFGFVIGADNAAHLGGAIAGAGLGWIMPITIRDQRKTEGLFTRVAYLFCALTLISLIFIPISWLLR